MSQPAVTVQLWQGDQPATEKAICQLLDAEGLRAYAWSNGPGDVYAAHTHPYAKVIYVVQGSITFGLPAENRQVRLRAGDRLDLPAGVVHNAVVGPQGVECLEAHR